MKKADRTATKVIFTFVFFVFVIGILQLLDFIFNEFIIIITSFLVGYFICLFGLWMEKKLYANS